MIKFFYAIIIFFIISPKLFAQSSDEDTYYKRALEYIKNDSLIGSHEIYIVDSLIGFSRNIFYHQLSPYPELQASVKKESMYMKFDEPLSMEFSPFLESEASKEFYQSEIILLFTPVRDNMVMVKALHKNSHSPRFIKNIVRQTEGYAYLFIYNNEEIIEVLKTPVSTD